MRVVVDTNVLLAAFATHGLCEAVLEQALSSHQLVLSEHILDEVGPTVAKGRSKADAPEIDGAVYLTSRRPLRVGEIVTARIERADAYDLHGSVAGF